MSALSLGAAGVGHQVRSGLACWSVPCPPPGEAGFDQKESVWCKPDFSFEYLLSQGLLLGELAFQDSSEVCVVGR